jgi:membrane associated rhomboid family serine protease
MRFGLALPLVGAYYFGRSTMPLIPIGTDVRLKKPPIGNYALIAVNIIVFLFTDWFGGSAGQYLKHQWTLYAAVPDLGQYVTYQFLHGDWVHLLGNMLFLWIFGNAVCDRMGSLCYVLFYLAGGIIAGVTFAAFNDNALLGASGAIAAVTTAFLVLYPRVKITMLLWFFLVTAFQIDAIILIVFKMLLWDNVLAPTLDQSAIANVAYSAHLGGYAFGFVTVMALVAAGILPRSQFDLLAAWSRWGRRVGLPGSAPVVVRGRPVQVQEVGSRPLEPLQLTPVERLREEAVDRAQARDVASAAELYVELLRVDPSQVLPRDAQLDVANYFAQCQRHVEAAQAYEAFLSAYRSTPDVHQVRLLLGLIYSRYLQQWERAAEHLHAALASLTQSGQRALAESELKRVEAQLQGGPRTDGA